MPGVSGHALADFVESRFVLVNVDRSPAIEYRKIGANPFVVTVLQCTNERGDRVHRPIEFGRIAVSPPIGKQDRPAARKFLDVGEGIAGCHQTSLPLW
jgi:hypothetical protein